MYIRQLYTKCLAEAAYYIESDGEAAIIDPLRDVEEYLALAAKRNAKIRFVFETHFHADFVSGHVELAAKTGATIVIGPTSIRPGYDAHIGEDGEIFSLGKARIRLVHTPGHTMESSCFVLINELGNEEAIFTGDTLFIGDVGRPDLAQKVVSELTPEKLASHLYDSLRSKIIPLPDHLVVYPAHGAGSACGKKMSDETTDTLGHQKKTNYALDLTLSREEFITQVLEGLTLPPAYFPGDVIRNIQGADSLESIAANVKRLSAADFSELAGDGECLLLDTREAQVFARGFIPGAINIGLDGSFAVWAGTMVPELQTRICLITEPGREQEAITRLARVGLDNIIAILDGGMDSWVRAGFPLQKIRSVEAKEFFEYTRNENAVILDVRRAAEYSDEHVSGAVNVPLDYISESRMKIEKNKTYYIYCAGGYRSMIFASILKAEGIENIVDAKGGFAALKRSGMLKIEGNGPALASK